MNKPKILSKRQKKEAKKEIEKKEYFKNAKMEDILRCDCCQNGFPKMDMSIGSDPYQSEINEDYTIIILCDRCHDDSVDSI